MIGSGPLNALCDVQRITVGHAEDRAARTGTTVIRFDDPFSCAVDVRGGGPATRETDAVGPQATLGLAHALVFSGGSVFGLAAGDAVARRLSADGTGLSLREGTPCVPIVPSACIYDLANGGDKAWGANPPYAALAEEATASAGSCARVGSFGAGIGALAGRWRGGLGQASVDLGGGMRASALVVVNAIGSPLMPDASTFWAWPFEIGEEFGGRRPLETMTSAISLPEDMKQLARPGEATCVGVVAVSQPVTRTALHRIATMAQDGFARALRPSHAPFDGDTLFAICPQGAPETDPHDTMRLGANAADCVTRAVARGVWHAEDDPDFAPTVRRGSV